jgi:hypothetical protein
VMEIVNLLCVLLDERAREKVGLLLVVALHHNSVTRYYTDSRALTVFSRPNTGTFKHRSTICMRRAFSSRRVVQETGRCPSACPLSRYSSHFTSTLGPHTSASSFSARGYWNKIFAIIPLSSCFSR